VDSEAESLAYTFEYQNISRSTYNYTLCLKNGPTLKRYSSKI